MAKTRGIVMKTSQHNTILYTEYGDYLKIKTPLAAPLLGQVMEVDLPLRKAISPSFLKIATIAAMLLLVLGVSVFNIVSGANTAVAAVVMDINNSKELLVNSDAKVLKVIDLNQGTQTSPSELKLLGKDIYTSVALMVDQANTQGGFKQGKNPVMASIIPLDNRQADIVDQAKLRDSIRRLMLEKNISSDLMVSTTDETTQKTAQNLGMSVNNYLVYKGLMANGFVVNPKGSGYNNTLHMLTEANTTLDSLFPKECVTVNPQSETPQETPNAMGTPMTGKNMPNTPPPTSYPMPNSSPKNITPSVPLPEQDNMPVNSGSGSHGMMP
ncbi:anti-sigma factor domain-containing protein [Desulfosporosinus sp. OT]|uniref:anti-sigma factor domain-containing protein n=1 Tax=Desulfosporosinus sp. OT TaxID=913865 RepID=UPI000223AB87|nr:anti-sigma factor domain-containing protein [Desulfosporosinus sp. OT]EGW41156.1 hypothetical protein DOT_0904 [Desulfosporosinus sp. OT]